MNLATLYPPAPMRSRRKVTPLLTVIRTAQVGDVVRVCGIRLEVYDITPGLLKCLDDEGRTADLLRGEGPWRLEGIRPVKVR